VVLHDRALIDMVARLPANEKAKVESEAAA
jgi:hypothetical protein